MAISKCMLHSFILILPTYDFLYYRRYGRNEFLINSLREIKRVSFEICESIVCW